MRDEASLAAAVDGCGAVVHLAAIAIERKGQTYSDVNTEATRLLIKTAAAAGATRFIHMSQNSASSSSPFEFLRSKGVAEDAVTTSSLEWTVLRPSVIFGPADEFVSVLARLAKISPLVFPLPDGGKARFQPVAVNDVARAVVRCLEKKNAVRETYALGGPEPLSLREMASRIFQAMGIRRTPVGIPVAALRPVISVLQRLLPNPPVTTSLLDLLALDNTVSENAIDTQLGIIPMRFAPQNLLYLRRITARDAVSSLFKRR